MHNDVRDVTASHEGLASRFVPDWASLVGDDQLDQLVERGFIVVEGVFAPTDLHALQQESGFIDYQAAHLTHGERVTNIRGDSLRWIDDSCPAGMQYLQAIGQLAQWFNRCLFTGIRHSEAHYACYPPGFGYQWHSDNPRGRDERVLSAVFYLNAKWNAQDGGELVLVDKHETPQTLLPKANRLVVFDSNLAHQVKLTARQRYSIATWMRRD